MGVKYDAGGEVFEPVVNELLTARTRLGDEVLQRTVPKLVGGLLNLGWGNPDASLGLYDGQPAVVGAFKEHGIVLQCMSEQGERGWMCEEERGHHPVTAHKDFQGNAWSDEESVQQEGR